MALFKKKDNKEESAQQPKTDKKSTASSKDSNKSMKDLYESDKKAAVAKKEKKEKPAKHSGNAYKVLVKPLITEKASNIAAENKYVFEVAVNANKIEIAKAINEVYGIEPTSVNILNMRGKKARYGRVTGRRKDWKKAIVTLPEGKTIKVYEGV